MGRLVHTGLGSSSLVAHVLHFPSPHVNSFFYTGLNRGRNKRHDLQSLTVCVCVCVSERERERESVRVSERDSREERERSFWTINKRLEVGGKRNALSGNTAAEHSRPGIWQRLSLLQFSPC